MTELNEAKDTGLVDKLIGLKRDISNSENKLENDFDCLTIDDGSNYDHNTKTYIKNYGERFINADQLLHFDNGSSIFYISKNGTVTTSSAPSSLTIYSFLNDDIEKSASESNILAFIQVDSWLYPLIPNETPIMKTNFDAYLFPNDDEDYTFVGLKFSNQINDQQRSFFEDILNNYGQLVHQDSNERSLEIPVKEAKLYGRNYETPIENENYVKSNEKRDGFVSRTIIGGANLVSKGVDKTANYAGNFIHNRGEQLKSKVEPRAQPVHVNRAVQGLFKNVRSGTEVPVKVSSYVTDKLSSIAGSATRKAASKVTGGSKSSNGILHVAGSGIKGFSMVQDSFENAAKHLANNLRNETVTIVDYK